MTVVCRPSHSSRSGKRPFPNGHHDDHAVGGFDFLLFIVCEDQAFISYIGNANISYIFTLLMLVRASEKNLLFIQFIAGFTFFVTFFPVTFNIGLTLLILFQIIWLTLCCEIEIICFTL
jgi:hypothetical protein